MPEYKCPDCGAKFFGWGIKGICRVCGSKLVPVNESAKNRVK